MSQIVWVPAKNLQSRYLTLSGTHPDTGEELRILCMHPLDCLQNRLGNINVLGRSDDLALRSAKAAVVVFDGFIDELLSLSIFREAQQCLRELEYVIKRKCANHKSFRLFEIDPSYILKKYAADGRLDERYRARSMAGSIARTERLLRQSA